MAASARIEASSGPLASFFSVLFTTLAAYFLHVPNYTKRTCASPPHLPLRDQAREHSKRSEVE